MRAINHNRPSQGGAERQRVCAFPLLLRALILPPIKLLQRLNNAARGSGVLGVLLRSDVVGMSPIYQ